MAGLDLELAWMPHIHREAVGSIPDPEADVALFLLVVHGVGTGFVDRELNAADPFRVRSRLLCPPLDEGANRGERVGVGRESLLGENPTVGVAQSVLAYHVFCGSGQHVRVGISRPSFDRRMPFLRGLRECPHISGFLHPKQGPGMFLGTGFPLALKEGDALHHGEWGMFFRSGSDHYL